MQKTAYVVRISDWSSDVCSSDLTGVHAQAAADGARDATQEFQPGDAGTLCGHRHIDVGRAGTGDDVGAISLHLDEAAAEPHDYTGNAAVAHQRVGADTEHGDRNIGRTVLQEGNQVVAVGRAEHHLRSEEHTSELQSLMRIS